MPHGLPPHHFPPDTAPITTGEHYRLFSEWPLRRRLPARSSSAAVTRYRLVNEDLGMDGDSRGMDGMGRTVTWGTIASTLRTPQTARAQWRSGARGWLSGGCDSARLQSLGSWLVGGGIGELYQQPPSSFVSR